MCGRVVGPLAGASRRRALRAAAMRAQPASWMRKARQHGGFLVLVGNSSVSKTRFLHEAVRDALPDFAVLGPDLGDGDLVATQPQRRPSPSEVDRLARRELQRFIDGSYLTPGSTPIMARAV